MKEKLNYWLRWLAVLPGALLASVVSTFVLHWSLYYFFKEFIQPYPETPERILIPLVMTSVFILTGNYIAPKYKNTISIILFGLLLFFIGGAVFSVMGNNTFLDEKVEFQIGGLPTIMSVLGAFYGLYEARKINKEDDDF